MLFRSPKEPNTIFVEMAKGHISFSILWILTLGILGSVVRYLYGYFHEPWNLAADHIAWEIVVQHGSFAYSELIHYPHEGGTLLITLLAKTIASLSAFNSLATTAFLLDFMVRCCQICIVKKVFGSRISIVFGIFTIFAYPIMIPWGTVNFGLHALSSIFPFIFLAFLHFWKNSRKYQFQFSLFLGLAIWFSYSNFIFIPITIAYVWLYQKNTVKYTSLFLPFLSILGSHLWVRYQFDPGFQLTNFSVTGIRGEDFRLLGFSTLKHLALVGNTLANGATISSSSTIHLLSKILFIGFSFVGAVGLFKLYKEQKMQLSHKLALTLLFLFLFIYGVSPFFTTNDSSNYILFRHLTYIFPVFGLMVLIGIHNTNHKYWYSFAFIIIGVMGSILLIEPTNEPSTLPPNQKAGWVLGTKFGHEPQRLTEIISPIADKEDLLIGIGWGITTSLFQSSLSSDSNMESKQAQFSQLIQQYPTSYSALLWQGTKLAFSPSVSPVLDQNIFESIKKTDPTYRILNKQTTPPPY